jgi:hypothetical protein
MLEGLDRVEWAQLWACGRATEIPPLLRALASPDATVRQQAWEDLYHLLVYQGLSITEATSYAVPFLLELLAAPSTEGKATLLSVLADITRGQPFLLGEGALDSYADEASAPPDLQAALATQRGWVQRARDAVEQGVPLYLTLLKHPEAAARVYAAALLAIFPAQAPVSVPPLHGALAQEVDERAQAQFVLSLGTLLEPEAAALHFLQRYVTADHPPLLRVAAAVAPARRARAATPAEVVPILVEAMAAADTRWPSYEQLPAGLLGPDYSLTVTLRETLAQVGPTQAVPALITALHSLVAQGSTPDAGAQYERLLVADYLLAVAFTQGVPAPRPDRLVMRFRAAQRPRIDVLYQQHQRVLQQEPIEVEATLEALQALLAAAFAQEQPLRAAPLARPGAPALSPEQRMALGALVDADAFWSTEGRSNVSDVQEADRRRERTRWHDLLTSYGLPASRDTLSQLLALGGAPVAEPLAPTLTPPQFWVVTVLSDVAVLLADGDHELRRRLPQLLMSYDLPTSRAALRDLLLG